jgi:hypothetical protein
VPGRDRRTVASTKHGSKGAYAVAIASDDQSACSIRRCNDIPNACATTNSCRLLVCSHSDAVQTRKVNENAPFSQFEGLAPSNSPVLRQEGYTSLGAVLDLR